MTLSTKSKIELLAEIKKLERKLKLLSNIQNISANKPSLPLNDSKWESFFKNSVNTILVIDKKGIILDINRTSSPSAKQKILGRTAYDFVEKSALKKMKQAIASVFKTKKSQLYDTWRIDEKGNSHYYRSKITAIIENKKAIAAIIDATDITNEIVIQNQLRQSEEKFKKLSDSAFEGIVIHQHGKIVEVNKALGKIFGYKEKELIGQSIFKFIHSDYHSLAREKIKTKEEKEYELLMLRKGKKSFWAEIMATELIYNNAPARVVAIRDITANKEYEKTIKESEERFRMLAQNAADIVFRYTLYPQYRYEYISPSVEKITGYSPEDYYSDPHIGIKKIHPQDIHVVREFQKLNRKKQLGKSEIKPMVLRWIRKDGGIIWIETVNNQIKDKAGKVIAIEGISRDITERKQAEEILKGSEEKFRMLAENASDLIYRYRVYPTNQYEYVGPSAKALTGYSPEEFYTQPMLGFKLTHPDDVHLLGDSEKLIKEKARLSNVRRSELVLRWIKKNGSIIWTETRSKPVFDTQGRLIAIEGISRDITKQKEGEERLKDSEERFKILSNVAFEGIILSENEKIIDANDQFVKMYGYKSVKEIIGKHIVDDFVFDKYKVLARKFTQLNKSEPFEVQAIQKNGTIITVEMKGQSIPYFGRNIRATVIYNITERKQYELELQQSRENYRALVEHSPDGILILIENKMVFANASAEKILETSGSNNLKNYSLLDFILPEYHKMLNDQIQRSLKGESIPFMDAKAKTLNGKTIEIETKPILITYNGKQAIQILIHDTATQKQLMKEQLRAQIAEETNQKLQQEITERKTAERVLQETQKYTRLLIDSSLDMICASDKNGNITEFNIAAQRTFGYELNEIVGKHVSVLYANPSERIRITNQELNGRGVFTGEVVNRKKNGETFITYLSASVLKNDKGETVGSMGVSRDISELKKAEEELKLSERKYRAIYDQAYIGIARVGLIEEDFIEVNQRLCNMLGYTSEELCNMTTQQITDSNDLQPHLPKHKAFHDNNSNVFSTEKRYVHKNGSIVYANLTTTLVKDATGKPQYFVSVYEDITERKKIGRKYKGTISKT